MGQIMYDFQGQAYIVTGASSGIGRATALALAAAGARVLAIARRREKLDELQAAYPAWVDITAIDLADQDSLAVAIADYAGRYKLSGTVHAAGVNYFMPLRVLKREWADEIMNTSFWAGMELIKLVTQKKYSVDGASHVMIASVAGAVGQPGFFVYSAAKSAVIAACRSLSLEIAKRSARLNTVSPGWVQTESALRMETMVGRNLEATAKSYPLGLGQTEDVVASILFLLSDQSRWITGTNLTVDGGYSAGRD